MDLVEDGVLEVPDNVRATVEHGAEDLGGHHETRGGLVELKVARDQPNVTKCALEVTILLVAQSFDGGRVDGSGEDKSKLELV